MHTSSTPPCRPGHCVGNRNSSWSILKTVKPESPNPPDYVLQVRNYALHCTKSRCADSYRHSTRSTPTTCSTVTTKPRVRKASTSAKFGTVLEACASACSVNNHTPCSHYIQVPLQNLRRRRTKHLPGSGCEQTSVHVPDNWHSIHWVKTALGTYENENKYR